MEKWRKGRWTDGGKEGRVKGQASTTHFLGIKLSHWLATVTPPPPPPPPTHGLLFLTPSPSLQLLFLTLLFFTLLSLSLFLILSPLFILYLTDFSPPPFPSRILALIFPSLFSSRPPPFPYMFLLIVILLFVPLIHLLLLLLLLLVPGRR